MPTLIRRLIIPLGALTACLLLFVIPNGGADNPGNLIGAILAGVFALAALLVELVTQARRLLAREVADG
jgi:hypothetical protein